jgi:hypothetical protein
MVCFVNVQSVDRIIYSIFQRFNLEWKTSCVLRAMLLCVTAEPFTFLGLRADQKR